MKRWIYPILCLCLLACALLSSFAEEVAPVYDDDVFEDRLRIEVDADDLLAKPDSMSMIDGKMGEITFTLTNVEAQEVPWTLRFTRDEALDGDMALFAGVTDEDVTKGEPIEITYQEDSDDPVITLEICPFYANTEKADVFFWNWRGAYYCVVIRGSYSQMQFAEAFDRILEATLDD